MPVTIQRNECAQFLFLCSAKALKKTWKLDGFAHDARFSFLVQLARSGQWRNLCQRNMKGHTTCDTELTLFFVSRCRRFYILYFQHGLHAKEKKIRL